MVYMVTRLRLCRGCPGGIDHRKGNRRLLGKRFVLRWSPRFLVRNEKSLSFCEILINFKYHTTKKYQKDINRYINMNILNEKWIILTTPGIYSEAHMKSHKYLCSKHTFAINYSMLYLGTSGNEIFKHHTFLVSNPMNNLFPYEKYGAYPSFRFFFFVFVVFSQLLLQVVTFCRCQVRLCYCMFQFYISSKITITIIN